MSRTYAKMTCPLCGKRISCAGVSKVSHLRSHVRRGEACEKKIFIRNRIAPYLVFKDVDGRVIG